MRWAYLIGSVALSSASVSTVLEREPFTPRAARSGVLAREKASVALYPELHPEAALRATLVQTHGTERVVLDASSPSIERFSELLADRATGQREPLDPRLLDLLRGLSVRYPASRIELVSGYRSAKLNEMLRKKGHHVASHSQHSLGHAIDFRIVERDDVRAVDPHEIEREIRRLGWRGGVGTYEAETDWFVHADVGPERRWEGQ